MVQGETTRHQFFNDAQVGRRYAFVSGKRNRVKPEFAFAIRSFNVYVWWLITFV
jgi:hypothetical protein